MKMINYNDVITYEHIEDAYRIIRKNTEHREKLLRYEMFYFSNMKSIEFVLKEKKYNHGLYHIFLVHEPKYRLIMSEGLSDKIVNHLISKYVLQPLIYPKIISTNVATRKEKGTKAAITYFKYFVNKLKQKHPKIYILKCDIKKYFYNIDHTILLKKIRELPMDDDLYFVLKNIIESTNTDGINQTIDKVISKEKEKISSHKRTNKHFFEELDQIPRYQKGKGLPIGNMSSQILALFYLNDLDHYIKEQLKIEYMIRYMDDFLLFHYDKEYLKKCWNNIENYLKNLKLSLNKKTQIYDLDHGINFLGYRFKLKGKKLFIYSSSKNKRKIIKKLKYLKKAKSDKYQNSKVSYKGYFDVATKKEFKSILRKIE